MSQAPLRVAHLPVAPAADRAALVAWLADRIDIRVPADATVLDAEDAAAVMFCPYPGPAGEEGVWIAMLARPGAPPVVARVATVMPPVLSSFDVAEMTRGEGCHPDLMLREPVRLAAPSPDGPRRRAIARIVASWDVPAVAAAEAARLSSSETLAWLSSGIPGSGAAQSFASAHPWLVVPGIKLCPHRVRSITETDGPDEAARHVVSLMAEGREGVPALVARMRGAAYPETWGAVVPEHVPALLDLPGDLFPPPIPQTGVEGEAMQAYFALLTLAPTLHALAAYSGRKPRQVLGPFRGWDAMALSLTKRSGLDEAPEDFADEWGVVLVSDALSNVRDMVQACARDLIAPALLLTGRAWPAEAAARSGHGPLHEAMAEDPVMAGAARLLLGDGTLPALAETSARWHARADGIARFVAGLAGEAVAPGPLLFEDLDLGQDHYLTCLNAVAALVDEGAPTADATGALGLDHCVGGFGEAVTAGRTAILSLRRRLPGGGYERVSTAEVDFFSDTGASFPHIVQHKSRRNAEPPVAARNMLWRGLRQVRTEAARRLRAFEPDPAAWPDTARLVADGGAWERMRDLWAFALTRPQRAMGPERLLAAAGIERA